MDLLLDLCPLLLLDDMDRLDDDEYDLERFIFLPFFPDLSGVEDGEIDVDLFLILCFGRLLWRFLSLVEE